MILVYAETQEGKLKKSAFEAVYFGSQLAAQRGLECHALVLGPVNNGGELGAYGAKKVWHIADAGLATLDTQVHGKLIQQVAQKENAKVVIVADSANGRSLLGVISVLLNAGAIRGVNRLPDWKEGNLKADRVVFSSKAFSTDEVTSDIAVLSVAGNTLKPQKTGEAISLTEFAAEIPAGRTKVLETNLAKGRVPLTEAEIVVSAGRGMKDPSNWGIVEDLAEELNATTACSRPVADSGWRPHHEHVGQTGIAIRPNLYIAIGISGAIQHLAGVNSSKVIVVINKDPEAPFFKAADYGVVGDLFEVVPKLTEAIKAFKAAQH